MLNFVFFILIGLSFLGISFPFTDILIGASGIILGILAIAD